MKQHRWVRHTVEDVMVYESPNWTTPEGVSGFSVMPASGEKRIVVGCDDCGQPLTESLFKEPCLSDLEDQLEAEEPEEGP